jgi:calcineurin-like phosphoesterase
VLGTHTHVPTADEQILPGGTAFICDVGMTGPYDSILGRRVDRVLSTTITFVPSAFDVATGDPRLAGAIVDIDPATGQSQAIRRVMLTEADLAAMTEEKDER